jgi:DNA-binding CsgD family transcriptional regulator
MKRNVTRQALAQRKLIEAGICPSCCTRPHGEGVLCDVCRAKSGDKPWRPGRRGRKPKYSKAKPVLSDRQTELARCYAEGLTREQTMARMGVSIFYIKILVAATRKRLACVGMDNEAFRIHLTRLCRLHPTGNIPSFK